MTGEFSRPFTQSQDSIILIRKDTLSPDTLPVPDSGRKDTTASLRKYSPEEIQLILERGERRDQLIDSIETARSSVPAAPVNPQPVLPVVRYLEPGHLIFAFDSADHWPEMYFQKHPVVHRADTAVKGTDFFIYQNRPDPDVTENQISSRAQTSAPDWFLVIFILIFIQLARIRLFFGKFLAPVVKSLVNYQSAHNLYMNKNLLYQGASWGFSFIFFLVVPLFVYQVWDHFEIILFPLPDFLRYLMILGAVLCWYILRYLASLFVGSFSGTKKIFGEYFHTISLSTRNVGLFLIPITLLLAYARFDLSEVLIYAGFTIFFVLYLLRVFRLFRLFISKNISVFYTILYLCALEILPVLILFRIIMPE